MAKFYDQYNLINSRPDERNAENAITWSYENCLLKELSNTLSAAHISILRHSVDQMKLGTGVYAQNPSYALSEPENPHDMYMSRDQLMSLFGMSMKYGFIAGIEIWEEIKRQKFRYDNVEPDSPKRYIAPWDLAFYGYCADSKIAKLFIPLVAMSCIISCMSRKSSTSGKLLAFIRIRTLYKKSMIMRQTWKLCTKLINRKYSSWKEVFSIYFPYTKHPNNIEARKVFRG